MRHNAGADFQAQVMGATAADAGTATGIGATSLTDTGKAWVTNIHAGKTVVIAGVYGVVLSNTATALTIDKWYTPGSPGGAAAATPATGAYVICPGGQPAFWLGISTDGTAPALADTVLAGELTTNGLGRAVATYAHTTGATSYTLSKTFTSSDPTPRNVVKAAIFNAASLGMMPFSSLVTSANLQSGDVSTVTVTVNLV